MKKISLLLFLLLSLVVPVLYAGTCTVDATVTNQYIHCIGASSAWSSIGSMGTALFANDNVNGHLGLSSLRARIDPNNSFSSEVNSLKQAQAVNSSVLCWATEWSPPAQYKANNNVNGGTSSDTFLGAESGSPNSADTGLASYQVSFIQYCKNQGVNLYALSIQNEPNFNPTYEACLWTAGQFNVYAQAFHNAIASAGLTTKIMLPEPDNTYGMNLATTAMDDATTSSYISIIGTHLYGTPNPGTLASFGYTHVTNQEYWETEMSGNTTDMPGALQEAGWIQASLVGAGMNAFHYWWLTDLISNNSFTIKAYVLGNYSKFIRPGYYRMGATAAPTSGILVSAFKDTNTTSPSKIVFVAINNNSSATSQTFSLNGLNVTSVTPWITDSSHNLVALSAVSVSGNSFTYSLPSSSVVSFVGTNNGTGPTSTNTPVVPTATSTPCAPTTIVPYIQVNGGAWTQTNSATVASIPATVNFGPQPSTGGSWSWSGPNGFTSTLREIDSIPVTVGTNIFTATYTNDCGSKSTQAFTVTVQGSVTQSPTTVPTIVPTTAPTTVPPGTFGGNPLMYQKYTADPTAAWYNNRMYIYCSHDQNGATGYNITDSTLMSSDDLVNWTDEGEAVKATNTSWAGLTYAPDSVYSNGYYYVYFGNGGGSIGVVRSTSPTGPFTDPLGHALITSSTPGCSGMTYIFDPAAFIDDDGQAYMYFGGGGVGNARVIKLNSDMISVNGSAVTIDAPRYFEAPFINKRNGTYYFSYCTDFSASPAASIDYMTSSSPMSGFTYRGTIMTNPSDNCGNNSHASIVNIGSDYYIAYHTRRLMNINEGNCNNIYERSVCLDRLYFNADGTIQKVVNTTTGVAALKSVNPYATNKAVTMAKESGIKTETCSEGGLDVTNILNGGWIQVKNIDFGSGAAVFNARVASATSGGSIQIRLDSTTGTIIGTCAVTGSGGTQTWKNVSCTITGAAGLHDVYFVFTGGSGTLFNFESYSFAQGSVTLTPTNTPVPPTATFTATKTNTPIPPTNTFTSTNTAVPPTATFTPTYTKTNTPIPPTTTPTIPVVTNTPVVPTDTPTTPVVTNTPVVPTSTPTIPVATNTPIVPTSTPTIPAATNTPTVPTATPTTPVPTNTTVPTFTPTVPVVSGALTVYLLSAVTTDSTNSPHPQIEVANSGTAALNLNNVEVRYWLNCDCTGQSVQTWVDWAGLIPAGTSVTGNIQTSLVQTNLGGQTSYISYRFTGSIVLQPGQRIEIQSRFNLSDWSNMLQDNDWSFASYTSFTACNKITGYISGAQVWGTAPSSASSQTAQVSSVLNYPNPASSSTGATLKYSVSAPAGSGASASGVHAAGTTDPVSIPVSGKIQLSIFTASGRLVWQRTLEDPSSISVGEHAVSWNGKTAGGQNLAAGTYILKVSLLSNSGASSGYSTIVMMK
jgi:arabinoxylan arabinofuranohydrolase